MKYFIRLLAALTSMICLAQQPSIDAYNTKMRQQGLLFMENKGQVADFQGNLRPDVLFTAKNHGAGVWLTANAIHYQFSKTIYPDGYRPGIDKNPVSAALMAKAKQSTHHFSITLKGSNPTPDVVSEGTNTYTENYYLPQCPDGILGVKACQKITYKDVYPGIDWVIYSKGGFMEYDFIVHPGGNPQLIKLEVKDAGAVTLTENGGLLIQTSLGKVTQKKPISYTASGKAIATRFVQKGDGSIGFSGNFPTEETFRIDPEVAWATYYGGDSENDGRVCAADSQGNVYLAGHTASDSGIGSNGFQNERNGNSDAFLAKFDSNGHRLWATYYGGSAFETGYSCAVDNNDNVYLAGASGSTDVIAFNAAQQNMGGIYDGFLVKFNSDGLRIWGTYHGGDQPDTGISCTTDGNGNVLFTGTAESAQGIAYNGFQQAYNGNIDSFLAKYLPDGHLLWSTYFGGTSFDISSNCVTDSAGNVYLAGTSGSNGLAYNGFQNNFAGGAEDAFLVKFDFQGNRLWATYYGGNASDSGSCAVDANDNVYIIGSSSSYSGIATTGAFKTAPEGQADAFIAKFDGRGARQWGTYFGGNGFDSATGTVDNNGNIYITGPTGSTSGIAINAFQETYAGGAYDFFVAKFDRSGIPLWSSYYGGPDDENTISCAAGPDGALYLAGITASTSGIASGGFDTTYGGGSFDAFLAKIDSQSMGTDTPVSTALAIRCYPNPVSNILTITAPQLITGIKLYTVTGQLLIDNPWNTITGTLNMQALQTGSYIVRVNCGDAAAGFVIMKAGE